MRHEWVTTLFLMKFSPQYLLGKLQLQPLPRAWQVAFSGGLDSTVLLYALRALRERLAVPVGAIHIHHGLQVDADHWADHCRAVCNALDIPLTVLQVDARPGPGDSPEAAARHARYTAIAGWLAPDHCLLTAQHRDDQAETLLLQLMRGAGVQGLAAMPVISALGQGTHLRPLLEMEREALLDYARASGLDWIEDPTNTETDYDRNFLRHEILPVLRSRWPSVSAGLSRSAAHAAEAAGLLDALAMDDRLAVAGKCDNTLSVTAVAALPPARQRNILRYWIRQQAGQAPSTAVLERVQNDMLTSREDAGPCVSWGSCQLRRYRDELFLLPAPLPSQMPPECVWQLQQPLALPGNGTLSATRVPGQGLRCAAVGGEGVRVRWRVGGETCRPAGRGHRHALKKLFQEAGVPPWQRGRIPLLYVGDELAAVAGMWICEPFQAGPQEPGYRIHWSGRQGG